MFSQAQIAMIAEVKQHPPLMDYLRGYPADDWGGAIGEIAAYVGICMEGNYMPHELEKLYDMITFKLRKKRMIIVDTVMRTKK